MHEAPRDVHLHEAASAAVGERRSRRSSMICAGALRREDLDGVVATRQARSELSSSKWTVGLVPGPTVSVCELPSAGSIDGPRPARRRVRESEASAGQECRGHDRDQQRRCDEAVPDRGETGTAWYAPGDHGSRATSGWRCPVTATPSTIAARRPSPGRSSAGREEMLSELDGEPVVHHAICSRTRDGFRSSASMAARSAWVARLSRDFVVPSGIPIACAASASGRSR